jgi:hypothetical protein
VKLEKGLPIGRPFSISLAGLLLGGLLDRCYCLLVFSQDSFAELFADFTSQGVAIEVLIAVFLLGRGDEAAVFAEQTSEVSCYISLPHLAGFVKWKYTVS